MPEAVSDTDVIDSLYRISSLLNSTDDPREALEIIIDEIVRVLPADSAAIELINPDTRLLEIEVTRGMPDHSKQTQIQLGHGVTGWVALHGTPLLVPDVTRDPRYIPIKPEIRSELAVPMVGEDGSSFGVVNIDSEQVDAFDERHLKVLSLLTNEATRVVSKLWLIRKLQVKADQLQALINAGRSLVKKRALRDLLGSLTGEALDIMDCRVCALFLLDNERSFLTLESVAGLPEALEAYEEELAVEDSTIGTALRRRKTIEILDLPRTEEHHFVEVAQREGLISCLACPMVYEDDAIGVLIAYTDSPHRFSNEERRILETLASLGAVAIQNARLYARIFQSEENLRKTEKLTTLGLLSAEIAHEIRNPLTVIRLLFESLDLQFESEDPRTRDVEVISEKLDQLEGIVSRVLSFGKSREELRSRFDLHRVIADTLHLVRLKLQQNRIDLHFETRGEGPFTTEINKGQIQQALLNLIINATQAMPEGGRISVALFHNPDSPTPTECIEISDTGAGVPDEIQDKIFDSFLSGHKEGTGLGLAIVKRILNSHGGDVSLMRSSQEGTTMRLSLPSARKLSN